MNDTYIKLENAIKAIDKEWSGCSFDGSGDSISDRCEDVLMEVPSIQIKFAKWVEARGSWCTPGGDPVWECSNCGMGRHVYGIEYGTYNGGISEGQWKTCPNCGAIMES